MKKIVLGTILVAAASGIYAKEMTPVEWEQCRDKAEASVNTREFGNAGVEVAVKEKCGEPPVAEPSKLTGIIGMYPYDVVRSKAFKNAFMKATQGKYETFVENMSVASPVELQNGWVFGSGIAPHSGGSEEAIFAINAQNGNLYGALLENGEQVTYFGFNKKAAAPTPIKSWLDEHNVNR